jgi:hypothetical protein
MSKRSSRAALWALAALLTAAAGFAQLGGGDPPIIIGDGSLTLASPRAPWAQWGAGSASERSFPAGDLAIAAVRIQSPGNGATIDVAGSRIQASITWGAVQAEVHSAAGGRNLRLRLRGKRFADFQPSADGRTLTLEGSDHISAVLLQRDGQTVLNLKGLQPATTVTFLPAQ